MNKETLKKSIYALGKLLGLLGLAFVLYTLSKEYTLETFMIKFSSMTKLLPLLLFLNILSVLLGIIAWHMMLRHYAKDTFNLLTSYYYFSKTEIAKYLPGNIFHFIGRQAFATKIGITQTQMAKISLLFSLLLLVATIISSTLFAFLAKEVPDYILILMSLSTLIALAGILLSYKTFPLSSKIKMNLLLSISVALQGIILGSIVLFQLDTFDNILFFQCVSIYIISWLVGFVTPGASGGLGVREGTFIAIVSFFHIDIASEVIVFSVLLVRLINILTDILLYVSTFMLESQINPTKRL